MIVLNHEPLSKHTTLKIGGIVNSFYIPENQKELADLASSMKQFRVLGAGSNILANDSVTFDNVISMENCCSDIQHLGKGVFYVGASVRMQKLIRTAIENGYCGIEKMFSIPCTVGGAVFMNAGVGHQLENCIGNFILSVKVLYNGHIRELSYNECQFGVRQSVFQQHEDWIIVGAVIKLHRINVEESNNIIKDRMRYCKEHFDYNGGVIGSVYVVCNQKLMRFFMLGKKMGEGIYFSNITMNWFVNKGKGTYLQAKRLLQFVEFLHHTLRKPIRREIVIWDK